MMQTESPEQVCLLCNSRMDKFLNEVVDARTLETFSILRCNGCGLEKTWPQPTSLAPYYSFQYYGNRHSFTAQYCARRRMAWVNKFHANAPGKLLDVGCGEGTFLLTAQRAGWQVAGTEMNPKPAQALGLNVAKCLQDIHQFAPFDCVTLWHSLEHMSNPHEVLTKIHALLSPNGTLLIAVPNAEGWQARLFGKKWLHRDVPRHLYHFGYKSLLKLIEINDFSPLKSWHQELEYDLLGWSQSALNCLSRVPNIFFDTLIGHKPKVSCFTEASNWMGGAALTLLAFPLVPLAALSKAGGTLIVAARRK